MKKRLTCILTLMMIVLLFGFGFALPVMAATAVGPPPPSVIDWAWDNLSYILGLALAVSELLAVTPWFKGNGILDYIIRGLNFLLKNKSGGNGASGDEGYGQGT